MLKKIISDEGLVNAYPELIKTIGYNQLAEALDMCICIFDASDSVMCAVELLDVWINLAAAIENAELYVFGMQLKVELLCGIHEYDNALKLYEELENMNIQNENMEHLKGLLQNG